MTDLPLTKQSETATTITLAWTPIPCLGYVLYANGIRKSNSWDPNKSSWKTDKAQVIRIVAVGATAEGVWPAVVVPPPPPSSSILAICANSGFPGNGGNNALTLKAKGVRFDLPNPGAASWCATNNVRALGLKPGGMTMALVDQHPSLDWFEYDNEPFYANVNIQAWSVAARDFGRAFKQKYPTKKLLLPMYGQNDSNKGDYNGPQGWKPWAQYVFQYAPDIGQHYDGWAVHPYNDGDGVPDFTVLDKVKGQLDAAGFTKPCYVTEVGLSVATHGETKQKAYLEGMVAGFRARPWVADVYWYCISSWNETDQQGSFGLTRTNGSERPAAGSFRNLT